MPILPTEALNTEAGLVSHQSLQGIPEWQRGKAIEPGNPFTPIDAIKKEHPELAGAAGFHRDPATGAITPILSSKQVMEANKLRGVQSYTAGTISTLAGLASRHPMAALALGGGGLLAGGAYTDRELKKARLEGQELQTRQPSYYGGV